MANVIPYLGSKGLEATLTSRYFKCSDALFHDVRGMHFFSDIVLL